MGYGTLSVSLALWMPRTMGAILDRKLRANLGALEPEYNNASLSLKDCEIIPNNPFF
jgi:hypothetical protein